MEEFLRVCQAARRPVALHADRASQEQARRELCRPTPPRPRASFRRHAGPGPVRALARQGGLGEPDRGLGAALRRRPSNGRTLRPRRPSAVWAGSSMKLRPEARSWYVPVEQKRTKSGGWTKGREIPVQRLINHQAEGVGLSDRAGQAGLGRRPDGSSGTTTT